MNPILTWFFLLGAIYFGLGLICALVFLFFGIRLLYNLSETGANLRKTTEEVKNKIINTPDFLVSLVTIIGMVGSILKNKESEEENPEKEAPEKQGEKNEQNK